MFKKLRGKLFLIGLLAGIWWWMRRPKPNEGSQAGAGEIHVETTEIEMPAEVQAPTPATKIGPVVAEAKTVEPKAAPRPRAKKAVTVVADDLTVISGIGPKIAGVLQAAGVTSFAQLAEADTAQLWQILEKAGIRLAKPESWIEQAKALHKE